MLDADLAHHHSWMFPGAVEGLDLKQTPGLDILLGRQREDFITCRRTSF
jgi:hypothetical protein